MNKFTFKIGSNEIPDWLKEQSNKGRVKWIYDGGKIIGGTIFTVTGVKNVGIGDVIVLTKSGLGVLPVKEKSYVKKEKNGYKGI